jgi:transposase
MAYVKGENRNQITLFPEVIDDYITEENQVRFIDAFVESLNLINFKYGQTKHSGRPPYNPKDLLKLYIYGYLNNIRSSRKLEKETHRNIEVFWLIQKLQPDHKTISNFRRDNKKVIKQVFKEFTVICKNLELFGGELIAIDGSKFEAVNSNNRAFTKTKLQERIKEIEKYIDEYFEELDKNDDEESGIKDFTKKELKEEIHSLQKKKEEYEKLQEQLENSGNTQICLTDSDSRLMRTGHNGKNVCYNAQVAADEKHNLIVDYEVTNHENDLNELSNISIKAKGI